MSDFTTCAANTAAHLTVASGHYVRCHHPPLPKPIYIFPVVQTHQKDYFLVCASPEGFSFKNSFSLLTECVKLKLLKCLFRIKTKSCPSLVLSPLQLQLRETDANLGKSSRILTGMLRR